MSIDPLLDERARSDAPERTPPWSPRHLAAIVIGAVVAAVVVLAAVLIDRSGDDSTSTAATPASAVTTPATPPTAAATTVPAPSGTTPSIDTPGSLWWLVNPSRPLPAGYVPPDLVTPRVAMDPDAGTIQLTAATAAAFEDMTADAAGAGYE